MLGSLVAARRGQGRRRRPGAGIQAPWRARRRPPRGRRTARGRARARRARECARGGRRRWAGKVFLAPVVFSLGLRRGWGPEEGLARKGVGWGLRRRRRWRGCGRAVAARRERPGGARQGRAPAVGWGGPLTPRPLDGGSSAGNGGPRAGPRQAGGRDEGRRRGRGPRRAARAGRAGGAQRHTWGVAAAVGRARAYGGRMRQGGVLGGRGTQGGGGRSGGGGAPETWRVRRRGRRGAGVKSPWRAGATATAGRLSGWRARRLRAARAGGRGGMEARGVEQKNVKRGVEQRGGAALAKRHGAHVMG
jgi:hypothetical protein